MSSVNTIMKKPITIAPDSSLFDVIRILRDRGISRLLVSNGNSIVTEKDVGLFLLTASTERKLDEISISELTKPLLDIDSSSSIKKCSQTMIEHGIGSLGVRENNTLVGLVTKSDLAKYFADNFSGRKIVGEYTTWYYAWVYSDSPLYKVVQKMVDERISRIILRGRNEIPEGILTFRDLFRVALQGNLDTVVDNTDPVITILHTRKGFLSESGFGGITTAKQIMTKKIVSVNYDDDLAKACVTLLENKINAAGVLSSRGTLIGILSKTDIVRALAFLQ